VARRYALSNGQCNGYSFAMTDVTLPESVAGPEPDSTRARILTEAVDMFIQRGYHRTTLRQLADRLGITKTAILYHFPAKDRIVSALLEPFVEALEAAFDRAAGYPLPECRQVLLEGILDTYLDFRQLLQMARTDATVFTHEPLFHRFMRLPARAVEIMIGPDADLRDRVWAVQLMGTLGDSVLLFAEGDPADLRAAVLAGTDRLLRDGPPSAATPSSATPHAATPHAATPRAATPRAATPRAATPNSAAHKAAPRPAAVPPAIPGETPPAEPTGGGPTRRVGRPRALSAARATRVREMYLSETHTVDEIAAKLGVSRATVYRYVTKSQN
jgi:AcrR family transcriptional regulator